MNTLAFIFLVWLIVETYLALRMTVSVTREYIRVKRLYRILARTEIEMV